MSAAPMTEPIAPWLDHLRVLLPPQSALLVGAGAGQGPWVRWLLQHGPTGGTTLVEADGRQFTLLQQLLAAERPAAPVQALNRVVAPERGDTSYYVASLAAESGLLDPQVLRPLWPNLRLLQQELRTAVSLQDLLINCDSDDRAEAPPCGGHWLLLDCLPAAQLLLSLSPDMLHQVDVLLARVLLDPVADAETDPAWQGACLQELERCLQGYDLARATLQPTRHPAIGHVLFVRDARASLQRQAATSAARAQRKLQDLQLLDERLAVQAEALTTLQVELAQERTATQVARERLAVEIQARDGLQQELAEVRSASHNLQAELERERSHAEALQADLDQEREHVTELTAQREEQVRGADALHQKLRQAAQAQRAMQAKLDHAEHTATDLQATLAQQLRERQGLQEKLERAENAHQAAQSELAAYAARALNLQAQLDAETKARNDSTSKLDQVHTAHQASLAEIQHIHSVTKDLEAKISQVEQVKSKLQQKLKETTEALQATSYELTHERKTVRDLQHKIAKQQTDQQSIPENHAQLSTEAEPSEEKFVDASILESESAMARPRFSGDASIDDFISDIHPFFFQKNINYVDVGAYVGEVLRKLIDSEKLRIIEAHLFEPNPDSYSILRDKVDPKTVQKLHLHNLAIGKGRGIVNLSAAKSMTKVLKTTTQPGMQTGIFRSEVVNLDAFLPDFNDAHIHLLKIDVEGSELDVLRGAHQLLLGQKIDVIYIEVGFNKSGTQQAYFRDVHELLESYDYHIFRIYEQKHEWIEDSPLLRRCNFCYFSATFAAVNPYKLTQLLFEANRKIHLLESHRETI